MAFSLSDEHILSTNSTTLSKPLNSHYGGFQVYQYSLIKNDLFPKKSWIYVLVENPKVVLYWKSFILDLHARCKLKV